MSDQAKFTPMKRRALALIIGLAIVAALEIAFRVADVAAPGKPAAAAIPRFSRLFVKSGDFYETNPSRRSFFTAQKFPAQKAPETTRVFIAGGSAAMGFPLDGVFGPAELISTALHSIFPGRRFEIVNAAGFGYASYRLTPVVEEIAGLDPDAVIVMSGNNEFLETRLPPGRFSFRATRIYRAIAGLVALLRGKAGEVRWEAHDVSPAERGLVIREFESNLRAMAEVCQKRGVKLILATCPANLKDFRPFGPSALPAAEQEKIDGLYRAGNLAEAAAELGRVEKTLGADAWVSFERGWVHFFLHPSPDRGKRLMYPALLWAAAKDNDNRPLRALHEINQVTRNLAANLTLADAEAEFNQSAHGAPGDELFFDHCHPNADGQLLLALSLLRALGGSGAVTLPADWEATARSAIAARRREVLPAAWAEGYYRAAFESGANLRRVHRGLALAEKALAYNPGHQKARLLTERLQSMNAPYLTGD